MIWPQSISMSATASAFDQETSFAFAGGKNSTWSGARDPHEGAKPTEANA